MSETKFTPGSLRAYRRNDNDLNWAIRDADNRKVAEHIPKELALLFVRAPEMLQVLRDLEALDHLMRLHADRAQLEACYLTIRDEARRIKAAIDGEG